MNLSKSYARVEIADMTGMIAETTEINAENLDISKLIDMDESDISVSEIVELSISDNDTLRMAINEKTDEFVFLNKSVKRTSENIENEIYISDIFEMRDRILQEESYKIAKAIKENTYSETTTQGGLIDIANPDPDYNPQPMDKGL